jgi:carboxymethylenebutenolidase
MPKIPQDVIDLYDAFTHGRLDRRTLMERLAVAAGSMAAGQAFLAALASDYARAATVSETDPRLAIETVGWPGPDGAMSGYLARPAERGRRPAVLVIHENRGLNPHIADVTRRLGLAGFLALGIDVLAPAGGTPQDETRAREMFSTLSTTVAATRVHSALPFLAEHPESTGKVGAVGFCWGGGMVNELAVRATELAAGVAYYGRQAAAERVGTIRAPLLLHYAENDANINAGIEAYEAALRAAGKTVEIHRYPGTQHAFNNDTGARYHAAAAALAWERTLAFLRRHLA